MSVSRYGLVKRETGEIPVRCRRCERIYGSPAPTVVGRGTEDFLPREPEDLLIVLLRPRFMVKQETAGVCPDAKTVHHLLYAGGAFFMS